MGALHTTDTFGSEPKNVMGCGLAIAYESDVTQIKPEDFAVISTNYSCPWLKNVDFQIPSDLPTCPEGGCHCMWGWVHSQDSGSEQMYSVGYRCNVTGATATQAIPPRELFFLPYVLGDPLTLSDPLLTWHVCFLTNG